MFTHSFFDRHLGCLHLLAAENNAAVYVHVQMPLGDPAFSFEGDVHRSGIVGSYGSFVFKLLKNCPTVSIVVAPFYISTNSGYEGSLFSVLSPAVIVCRFFEDGQSDWCKAHYIVNIMLDKSNEQEARMAWCGS